MTMSACQPYIESNRDRFLEELFELLRIPSVSADPAFAGDVQKCAELVAKQLEAAGGENVEIITTEGYPVVYGEKLVGPDAPTVLVYGHYDVQPADPLELWDAPAFEPVIKNRHPPRGRHLPAGRATTKNNFSCTSRPWKPWCRAMHSIAMSSS